MTARSGSTTKTFPLTSITPCHTLDTRVDESITSSQLKRIKVPMSQGPQSISGETENLAEEADLSHLPDLPPGVFIPAPGATPRRRTRWPDAIDVIFEKDPACHNIIEALLYQGLWAIFYHRIAHVLY